RQRREVPRGPAAGAGRRPRHTGRGGQGAGGVTVATTEELAVGFAAELRREGVPAPTGSVVAFVESLAELGTERPDHVYWAGRATLTARPDEAVAYDRAFARFWLGQLADVADEAVAVVPVTVLVDDDASSSHGPIDAIPTDAVQVR